MTIGELLVKLGLDASGFSKSMSSAESSTKTSMGNVGKHMDAAGKSAGKLHSALSGIAVGVGVELTHLATEGIGKVVDVLGDAEKAYQDAAVSTAKMTTALKNNVPGFDGNTAAINKTIDANLKYGFSADDQRSAMALLVGVTKNVTQAQKDESEAMDLARLRGVDLASATNIIIKAQEGNLGALKKLGIVVAPVTTAMDALTASHKKATAAQIAAAKAADLQATETAALTAVTKLAGGQAEAYADTSAGKLAGAHAKVTEAMVKLGSITDQIVQAVLPALADAFGNIMDAVAPFLEGIGTQMPSYIATARQALDWITTNVLPPLQEAFQVFTTQVLPALGAAFTWIVENVLPKLVAAFQWFMTNVWPVLVQAFQFFVNDIMPPVVAALAALADFLGTTVAPAVSNIVKAVIPPLVAAFKTISDFVSTTVVPVIKTITDFFVTTLAPAVTTVVKTVIPPLVAVFKTVSDFVTTTVVPVLVTITDFFSKTLAPAVTTIVKTVVPPLVAAFKTVSDFLTNTLFPAFGTLVKTVLPPIQTAIEFITSTVLPALGTAIGIAQTAFKTLGDVVGTIWSGISSAVKGAINIVIGAIDTIIGGINAVQIHMHFDIPFGPSIGFDWNGMNIGKIPYLHSGGIVPGAPGTDVLTMLQAGERVTPARDVAAGRNVTNNITVNNPTPEPASSSIQRTLLTLQATGHM